MKNVSKHRNCTIFKMADENHGVCRLTYTISLYDSLNQTKRLETHTGIKGHTFIKCYKNQSRFDRIGYANIQATMNENKGPELEQPIDYQMYIEGKGILLVCSMIKNNKLFGHSYTDNSETYTAKFLLRVWPDY